MDPETFEQLCISYLYNELDDEERRKFQHLLATDRDSNIKFNAIRRSQSILSRLQEANPPADASPDAIRAEVRGAGSLRDDASRMDKTRTGAAGMDASRAESTRAGTPSATGKHTGKRGGKQPKATESPSATDSKTGKTEPVDNRQTKSRPEFELRLLSGGPWARAFSAAAAVLFALLIFGAVTGLQVRWDDSGFALNMSLFGPATEPAPAVPTYLLREETLEQLRRQQEELFSEIMAAEREQQRIMLLETLSEYAEAIETRRMIDMQLIGMELADFQQQTNQQLSQTDRIIYQLIETLSYNQEQQDDRE